MTSLIRKSLRLIAVIFVLGALADLVALSYPILLQHLIDSVSSNLKWSVTDNVLALVIALTVGGAAVTLLRDLLATFLCGRVDFEASELLLAKIVRVPLNVLRERSTGDWLVALQQIQELKLAVGMLGTQAAFDVMLIFGYVGILLHYDALAALIYVIASGLILVAMSLLSRTMYNAIQQGFDKKAQAETYVMETLKSPLLVRAFRLGDWVKARWSGPYRDSVWQFQKADYLSGIFGALFVVIRQAAPLLILAWKLPAVSRGQITFGQAFALSTVFGLGFDPLMKISAMISQLQKIIYGFRTTQQILALEDEPGVDEREEHPAQGPLGVVLENLSFRYPTAETTTLLGLNAEMGAGRKIAIVGHSGSGKSTLFQLLAGIQRPTSGRILLGGRSIDSIPVGVLRSWVGVVSQDTELFTGTILENIALGASMPDRVSAAECARLAGISAFIEGLPEGLDSRVGEGGCTLSAGQRQRISIARAIYSNPRLLLLDEPTSALDAVTEREIATMLPQICAGRTLVVAAHRLASVKDFDSIYVMDKGRVAEFGTHDQLLANRAGYWRLWNAPDAAEDLTSLTTPAPGPAQLTGGFRMTNYTIALNPSVSWTNVDGQTVLFSKKSGDFYGMNETGAFLIQELSKSDREATVAKVATQFDVPTSQVGGDLDEIVESLLKADLISRTPLGAVS